MKPLKIFLADLTYDTINLSTDVFPLNIGYIAALTKAQFGSDVEIKLFKYIKKIEDNLGIFGDTPAGRSQVIKVIPESKWWRRPVIV